MKRQKASAYAKASEDKKVKSERNEIKVMTSPLERGLISTKL